MWLCACPRRNSTVENISKNCSGFWTSEELEKEILKGDIISVDIEYFVDKVVSIYKGDWKGRGLTDAIERDVQNLLAQYIVSCLQTVFVCIHGCACTTALVFFFFFSCPEQRLVCRISKSCIIQIRNERFPIVLQQVLQVNQAPETSENNTNSHISRKSFLHLPFIGYWSAR